MKSLKNVLHTHFLKESIANTITNLWNVSCQAHENMNIYHQKLPKLFLLVSMFGIKHSHYKDFLLFVFSVAYTLYVVVDGMKNNVSIYK